jgi:hypothetical protein
MITLGLKIAIMVMLSTASTAGLAQLESIEGSGIVVVETQEEIQEIEDKEGKVIIEKLLCVVMDETTGEAIVLRNTADGKLETIWYDLEEGYSNGDLILTAKVYDPVSSTGDLLLRYDRFLEGEMFEEIGRNAYDTFEEIWKLLK